MSRFVLTAQLQLQAPTNTAQIVRQIQSQLNNVQVNVQVQGTAQATRQVQQVAQSLNAANSAASNLGRTFAISVKRFTALAVATRAVSLFTNTLANATQEAIDFERQLIKVSQVTGQSIGELKGLTKTITTLATGLGVGSKSLLEVSTILLQAGLNARDTEVALKSLAKAALAPNFDSITETAEGAIAILAQFQQGVGSLEGQLSSINAVAGAFAVEAGDLIDVIRRTGGVFKSSGGSLNELLALFTSVRATTRESAESIGTGLRTIFTRIQRPKTIEFLKQFGVELVDLEGKFVGPFEAVRRLSQALAGLGEGDITFIRIAEELGGFRQIGKVLPLIQQFSTAQAALNVAQKAGNGLTKDAQTAQQALAIRITKVKEEFLALVRSITETSSFQFFANTTLNLASALIKLADALKPIIPLLAAVAGIKLAKGLSGFIGGFGRGIGSGRTFNEGGKVLKFARGGMVPGSGNRDTVPAMLQPGEFVIRKSSVNKLGAGNLAAMNENRFQKGGKQGTRRSVQEKLEAEDGVKSTFKINDQQIQAVIRAAGDKDPQDNELDIGAAFLQPEGITRSTKAQIDKTGISAMLKSVSSGLGGTKSLTKTFIQDAIGTLSKINIGITSGSLSKDVAEQYKNGINTSLTNFSSKFASQTFKNNPPFDSGKFSSALNRANIEQVEGNIFEAFVNGLSNSPFTDTKINPNDTFDFPFGLGSAGSLFNLDPSLLSDAKRTFSEESLGSLTKKGTNKLVEGFRSTVAQKLIDQNIGGDDREKLNREKAILAEKRVSVRKKFFGGLIQKFAKGGSVKNINILSSALQGFNSYEGSSKDILAIEGLSSLLSKIQQFYSIKSAKVIGAGEENIAFDIGKKILKISKTGFGSQLMAKSFGFKNKELKKIGNYQLSNSSSVTGYEQIKTFGKLTAALQNKVSLGNDKKRMKDYQILKGKLSKSGQYWLDAHPENMGYDKLGNPTVIDGLVFPKTFVNKNLNKNKREDIELESMTAESIYESQFNKKSKNKKNTKRQKYLNFIANLERMYALAIGGKAGKDGKQIIQKFAKGGMAQPLVDDILSNAPNTILPKPQSAIQKLINSGGGFVDIDRTLKRTIGDQAYARARTEKERQAVLSKYFTNSQNRLNDIKTAGLTQFGTELQNSIKSGQLSGSSIRVISKSPNTPGVAEYLSGIFGIPSRNFAFTGGRSKVPLMRKFASGGGVGTDTVPALLTPGEFVINKKSAQSIGYGSLNRMNKVGKYASGGVVQKFAVGGSVTSKSVRSSVQSNTSAITQQIATTSQEIVQTGKQIKNLGVSIAKQTKVTDNLYKESTNLDAKIKVYDQALIKIAQQQGKAVATGTAANRILDLKIKAEQQRIDIDNKALAQEQTLTKMKEKQTLLIDQQNKLLAQKDSLVQQAKQTKQAATQQVQSTLVGGQQTNFASSGMNKTANQQAAYAQARANNSARQSQRPNTFFNRASNVNDPMDSKDIGMMAIGLTSVTAALQSMLPPLDENSSAFTKLAHSSLSLVTQIGAAIFALNSFGISLNKKSVMNFLGGGGLSIGGKRGVLGMAQNLGFSRNSSVAIMRTVNSISKLAGPLTAIVGSATLVSGAFNTLITSMYDYDNQLQKATEKGDVKKAGEIAGKKYDLEAANTMRTGGAMGGAAIGFVLGGPIGSAIGAAIGTGVATIFANVLPQSFAEGINVLFGGNTRASAIALAEANAQAVKTSKELAAAEKTTADAIKEFEDGTINAATALERVKTATATANTLREKTDKAVQTNLENRSEYGSGKIARNIFTLGGLIGESAGERNSRIDAENAKMIKDREQALLKGNELRTQVGLATARPEILAAISQGKTPDQIKQTLPQMDTLKDIRQQALDTRKQAAAAQKRGDTETADALSQQADALREQANNYEKSIDNLIKEQTRLEKALKALDLGLRGPASTASAAAAELEYFASQIEGTALPAVSALNLLEASFTSAGAAMNKDQLKQATDSVVSTLQDVGATASSIDKFRSTTEALNNVQSKYGSVAAQIAEEQKKSGKKFSDTEILDKFAEKLGEGMPDEIKDLINGIQLTDEIRTQIARGDYSGIGDAIGEQGKKLLEPINNIVKDYQRANQVLIDLTKKRIDAERSYVSAVKEAEDLAMEGREIQAKYGGAAVTMEDRRQSILNKANAGNRLTGLSQLQTGGMGELRARNREIAGRYSANQAQLRSGAVSGKAAGEVARQQQDDLKNAQKEQVQTIRDLIKLEEENLKLIGEKNKLEKDSIDALVSGDIDKFFEQQAAAGAQAAIALGSDRLQGAFGANALGAAAQDIRRQQEAGQQTLFGQQLAGQGGLTERAFGAAIGARGVTDSRLAQVAAGTTAEEELAKSRLRDLGGALGEAGQLGADLAQMDVKEATMNVAQAEIKLQEVIDRGKAASAQAEAQMGAAVGRRLGGLIYANRGVFVPRGTDTVPAMLTPGEFVVRREAVQRGNNLQMLQAMNRGSSAGQSSVGGSIGMARGGIVRYRQGGSTGPEAGGLGINPEIISRLAQSLDKFNTDLSANIEKLNSTNFSIKLDTTNVNVNLNGGSFLNKMKDELREELMKEVASKIQNYKAGEGGSLKENRTVLG